MMGGYPQQQPMMGGYPQQQPMGGYPQQQPMMGGYPQQQPMMGGYPQTHPTGMYVAPGMHQQPVAQVHVGAPGHGVTVQVTGPHGPHVLPHCMRCHNTHIMHLKPCPYCVCRKCGGSGFNQHKHKHCKKIKVEHH
jgi:hypothetical protein